MCKAALVLFAVLVSTSTVYAQENQGTEQEETSLSYLTPSMAWADFMASEPLNSDLIQLLAAPSPYNKWSLNELQKRTLTDYDLALIIAEVESESIKDKTWHSLLQRNPDNSSLLTIAAWKRYNSKPDLNKYSQAATQILMSRELSSFEMVQLLRCSTRDDVEVARKLWSKLLKNNPESYYYLDVFRSINLERKIRKEALTLILNDLTSMGPHNIKELLYSSEGVLSDTDRDFIASYIFNETINDSKISGYNGDYLQTLADHAPEPYKSMAKEILDRIDRKRKLMGLILQNNKTN